MSWFFVDDGFYDHPKLALLSPEELAPAVGLWCLAGTWSRKSLTGGTIPYHQVTRLGCTHSQADCLVRCELWKKTETGYVFHDWSQWQETPEEVEEKRRASRARSQKWRDKKAKKAGKKRHASRDASPTHHSRVTTRAGDARVPGEGEGEGGTWGGGSRERESSKTPNRTRADALLAELQNPNVLMLAGGRR